MWNKERDLEAQSAHRQVTSKMPWNHKPSESENLDEETKRAIELSIKEAKDKVILDEKKAYEDQLEK
jgi:hypothetical protein